MVNETLSVYYHDLEVAVISYDTDKNLGYFEYTPEFVAMDMQLSPLKMPLKAREIYQFPQLNPVTFKGLAGLVADSLPDRFGTSVLNQWVAQQGRTAPISVMERLQYTGTRGMGALEFRPSKQLKNLNASQAINLEILTELAQSVVNNRKKLKLTVSKDKVDTEAMMSLLAVGTSAGGARPKAVLAFNHDFSQVRSGQVKAPVGFEHYLMKFDGVSEHNENEETFGDPLGYGTMEYVYYLMAKSCGIDMQECYLLDEGSRRHFITQRFDREGNDKIHIQTLTAMDHVDYNTPGSYSYEELFGVARQLRLPLHDAKQLFLRMVFNHIARNNDDHSKNFSFIYKHNKWRLSPAYDMAYCYKPNNLWVERHWMSANGKRIDHRRADLIAVGANVTKLPHSLMHEMIDNVLDSVAQWNHLAKAHAVPKQLRREINQNLPLMDFRK
ncbi:MAG: type II toxin-antitoxin system HipA family toxin [Proteobacteria bacterium]|nr:type II toxin-antitoxin system HipA family toxin [Pseudomonadota bacterium]